MFDPTIFDNLKVVLEGSVYDLDMDGSIQISNREDQINLSTMSRYYAIRFVLPGKPEVSAEISLLANMRDLAAEILEQDEETPGCAMEIAFRTLVLDPHRECETIHTELIRIWLERPEITQTLSFDYKKEPIHYKNEIRLHFGRKVNEAQIEDFPELLRFIVKSLKWLNARNADE